MNNFRSCAKREIYERFQLFVHSAIVSVKVRRFRYRSAKRSKIFFCGNVHSRGRGALFTQQICTQFFVRVRKNNYRRMWTVAHARILHSFTQESSSIMRGSREKYRAILLLNDVIFKFYKKSPKNRIVYT